MRVIREKCLGMVYIYIYTRVYANLSHLVRNGAGLVKSRWDKSILPSLPLRTYLVLHAYYMFSWIYCLCNLDNLSRACYEFYFTQ